MAKAVVGSSCLRHLLVIAKESLRIQRQCAFDFCCAIDANTVTRIVSIIGRHAGTDGGRMAPAGFHGKSRCADNAKQKGASEKAAENLFHFVVTNILLQEPSNITGNEPLLFRRTVS